jgi:hypothetical protein
MSELLDDLARALTRPMPRSRVLRLLGGALASAAVSPLRPRLAGGATKRPLDECDHPLRCVGKKTCGLRDPKAGPSPIPVCNVACCDDYLPVCCKWPGYMGSFQVRNGSCAVGGGGTVCCCPAGYSCGEPPKEQCRAKVCGPDIADELTETLSRVKSAFASWGSQARYTTCLSLVTLPAGAISWDISELGPGGRERFADKFPDCATCGYSVQVGRDCHYAGSVNYVAYGLMMRLCRDHLSKEDSSIADWFTQEEMLEMIYIHKNLNTHLKQGANFAASNEWALVGYRAGSIRPTPQGDRHDCKGRCSEPYSGPGFTVRWLPKVIRPK